MKNVLKKSKKKYTKLRVKAWYVFLFCILVLLVPLILSDFSVKGYEPYLYGRLANLVGENYDGLSYGGRIFVYNFGNPILLNILSFMPLNLVLLILPIILGTLSLGLFYYILKTFKTERNIRIISSLILIISPPFLYAFTNFNYFTVPIFLILLGFYFFIKDKTRFYILSLFISLLLVFFSVFNVIIFLLILFLYCIKTKRFNWFLIIFVCNLVLMLVLNYPLFKYGLPEKIGLGGYALRNLIFDLGGGYGISLFLLFLLFFGFSKLWESKYKNSFFYVFFLLFIMLLFFSLKFVVYFNFFLCFLASLGILKILQKGWESNLVKNLTLLFLICGLLFSGVSFFNENVKTGPSEKLIDALTYLKNSGDEDDVVLSYYDKGYWINSIAGRKNVLDGYFDYAPNVNERLDDVDHVFRTRSMDRALEIIDKYNITYILITKDMKEGLVWFRDNEGLLFLLKNNPNFFNLVYDKNDIEIWRVL